MEKKQEGRWVGEVGQGKPRSQVAQDCPAFKYMVERTGEVSWMSQQGQLCRHTTSALTQGPEGPNLGLMLCCRVLEIYIIFEQSSLHHPFVLGPAVMGLA